MSQFCLSIQSKMSDQQTSIVVDQGRNVEVEDLRLKIKRAAKAKQTEALAANLVARCGGSTASTAWRWRTCLWAGPVWRSGARWPRGSGNRVIGVIVQAWLKQYKPKIWRQHSKHFSLWGRESLTSWRWKSWWWAGPVWRSGIRWPGQFRTLTMF